MGSTLMGVKDFLPFPSATKVILVAMESDNIQPKPFNLFANEIGIMHQFHKCITYPIISSGIKPLSCETDGLVGPLSFS